jgi:hypothetical protein
MIPEPTQCPVFHVLAEHNFLNATVLRTLPIQILVQNLILANVRKIELSLGGVLLENEKTNIRDLKYILSQVNRK